MSSGKFPGKHPETELSPADDPGKSPMGEHKPPSPETMTPKEPAESHHTGHQTSEGAGNHGTAPAGGVNLWNAPATHHNTTPHPGQSQGQGHGHPHFGPQNDAHPSGGRSELDEVQSTYVPGLDPPHSVNALHKASPAEHHGGLRLEDGTAKGDTDHHSGTGHQGIGSPGTPLPGSDFGGQEHHFVPGADNGGHQHGTLPGSEFGGQDHNSLPEADNGEHQHGTLPGTDFGGQDPGELPGSDGGSGHDHVGSGMDHAFAQAEMGPPPGIA